MAQPASSQLAKKSKDAKGPRALGLIEISSDGKARLVPIAIMVDGKFYDAGAYKASPVPLALWNDTVYEGEKTGVPQGLFTVAEAMRTGSNNWFGAGNWRPGGSEPKPRKVAAKPKMGDEDEGPPKLRRSDATKPDTPKPAEPTSTPSPDDKKPTGGGTAAPGSTTPANPPTQTTSPAPSTASDQAPDASAPSDANDDDPNRPILKRGKTGTQSAAHPEVGASTGVIRRPVTASSKAPAAKATTQSIPAISDAAGPDPRPYSYDIKPDEEEKYRKGMLALASDALLARMKEISPPPTTTKSPNRPIAARRPAKPAKPTFDNVQFHAFDLWNTNEPIFVLSATAHAPAASGVPADSTSQPYYVTIVAKKNIYDELRKLYTGVTDQQHLDMTPRLELIDAVDADGDGRGELLFRRITDTGPAWGVYRAGADQLFPLFEGTPPGQ